MERKYYENLTRDEAISMTSKEDVDEVEHLNCEPTCGFRDDDLAEWKASLKMADGDRLEAYYYTTPEEEEIMAEHDGDGSYINWEIDHYVIID